MNLARRSSALGIVLCLLGGAGAGHAYDTDKALLRGLGSLVVDVPDPGDAAEIDVTTDWIRAQVMERLGLQSVPIVEAATNPAAARLRVRVGTVRIDKYHYAYSVHIGLRESAALARDAELAGSVETWESTDALGYALTRNVREQIRGTLIEKLDQFIDDYLATR